MCGIGKGDCWGGWRGSGSPKKNEAALQALTQEALKSSEIEGESLRRELVRSAIARRLGLEAAGLAPVDRRAEGLAEMVVDATRDFAAPLTKERLFSWHSSLFAGGHGPYPIAVGRWRDDSKGPMQVVSGQLGAEKVHYEAPPAARLESDRPLNERQRLMLNKLLDGFEGKLTSTRWAKIAKRSQDTAHRDIMDLVERGILMKDPAGGRSTSYSLRQVLSSP